MTAENSSTQADSFYTELNVAKECVYDQGGLALTALKQHSEGREYGACSFLLNGRSIQYRVSKITPTKTGQFVAIWKRNKEGITAPFDTADDLDFLIIAAKSGDNFGQFIFPKYVLADHGILTNNCREGKRGIRVYPPWDIVTNKQAEKTQSWQTKYFLTIHTNNSPDLALIERLFRAGVVI